MYQQTDGYKIARVMIYIVSLMVLISIFWLYDNFSPRIFNKDLYFKKCDEYLHINVFYYQHDNPTTISTHKINDCRIDTLQDIYWSSPFKPIYAMTDSSLILFVFDSVKIPKDFNSKVKIEQVIACYDEDSLELKQKYSNLEIRRVSDDFKAGTDTWFKRFKDIHNSYRF